MFCPNCGRTNSEEQRFCRSCGLSLERIAQLVVEQLPAQELDKRLRARQRLVERLVHIVGGSAIAIVVGAVLWGIIYEVIIVKGEVLGGSIFLAVVVGLILSALLAIYNDSLAKASGKRHLLKVIIPSPEKNTAALLPESSVELMPSVTERTTELLAAEKQDPKKGASGSNKNHDTN
jgi:hypothetical protein